MNKREKNILIIIIVILIIALAGVTTLYFTSKNKVEKPEIIEEPEPTPEPEELNYKINIYKCEWEYSDKPNTGCNEVAFQIPTATSNAEIKVIGSFPFILYNDNGLKIFDIEKEKIEKIKLPDKYDSYMLNMDALETEAVGIIYSKNNNYGYYNIKQDKILYENEYDYLFGLNEDYIQGTNGDNENNTELFILDTSNEKVIKKETDGYCKSFTNYNRNNQLLENYLLLDTSCMDSYITGIYTKDFKLIINSPTVYNFSNSNLYNLENNEVKVYNKEGNVIKSYNVEGKVVDIFNDYYLTIINNTLYIKDYNSFTRELTTWSDDYMYDYYKSVYYEGNDKKSGYYFSIYDYNNSTTIDYYFNPQTNEIRVGDLS